jgi:hypothetical protein
MLSRNFSNDMINSTSLNEVHYALLKQYYPMLYTSNNTCVSLVPLSKHDSISATHIGTPVLTTHQDEVRNRRRRH